MFAVFYSSLFGKFFQINWLCLHFATGYLYKIVNMYPVFTERDFRVFTSWTLGRPDITRESPLLAHAYFPKLTSSNENPLVEYIPSCLLRSLKAEICFRYNIGFCETIQKTYFVQLIIRNINILGISLLIQNCWTKM